MVIYNFVKLTMKVTIIGTHYVLGGVFRTRETERGKLLPSKSWSSLVTTWTEGLRNLGIWAIGHGQHGKDIVIKFDIETGARIQEYVQQLEEKPTHVNL